MIKIYLGWEASAENLWKAVTRKDVLLAEEALSYKSLRGGVPCNMHQGSTAIVLNRSSLSSIPRQRADTRPDRLFLVTTFWAFWYIHFYVIRKTNFKNIQPTSLFPCIQEYKTAFISKPTAARLILWCWDVQPTLERQGKRHQQTEKTANQEWSWRVGRVLILLSIHKLQIRKPQVITAQCFTTAVGVAV